MRRRSPYLGLLAVFVFAWLALLAYALVPRSLVLFGTPVAKADIAPYLGIDRAPEPLPEAELAGADEEAIAEIEAEATAAPLPAPPPAVTSPDAGRLVDESPQRILVFGDSMVQALQPRLTDYCLENGHALLPAIWFASTTVAWAAQDKLRMLINEFKPTMVIAVLGSSEISSRNVEEREKFVRAIVRKVGDRKFAWIGPPNWREDTGINALLERVLGPGRFFRSAELELERTTDGIHPTPKGGVKWTEAFVRWLSEKSAYPIALATPTRTAPRIPARVYPPPY